MVGGYSRIDLYVFYLKVTCRVFDRYECYGAVFLRVDACSVGIIHIRKDTCMNVSAWAMQCTSLPPVSGYLAN